MGTTVTKTKQNSSKKYTYSTNFNPNWSNTTSYGSNQNKAQTSTARVAKASPFLYPWATSNNTTWPPSDFFSTFERLKRNNFHHHADVSLLQTAIRNGDRNRAKDLIESKGANAGEFVCALGSDSVTPLMTAIQSFIAKGTSDASYLQIVNDLITYGADVDAQNEKGLRPFHLTAVSDSANIKEVMSLLTKRKADVSVQDIYGETPLHFAIKFEKLESVKALINCGPAFGIPDAESATPIDAARGQARVCASSTAREIHELVVRSAKTIEGWAPHTHLYFPQQDRERVMAILMLANREDTGFFLIGKDVVLYVLHIAISREKIQ